VDEFVSAFDSGAPAGWGNTLDDELHARGLVELNQFGALRLTPEGEEACERGVEDDYAI